MESFKIKTKIIKTTDLNLDLSSKSSEMIVQILEKVNFRRYLSGKSGRNYLNPDLFKKAGIKIDFQQFEHPTYTQLFGPFVPNLAAVDLLFNEGENAEKFI